MRGHGVQALQGRAYQAAYALVTAGGFFRQPCVHQQHRHLGVAAGVDHGRPDFGFHQQQAGRLRGGDETAHPAQVVVRQVMHLGVGVQLLRGGPAGGRHLGNQQAGLRVTCAQGFHQRQRSAGFAHRHGVQPDLLAAWLRQAAAKALVPVFKISRRLAGALFQVTLDQRREQRPQGGIQLQQHQAAPRTRASSASTASTGGISPARPMLAARAVSTTPVSAGSVSV